MTTPSDQELADLRNSMRGLLERRCDSAHVRSVVAGDTGVDVELWHTLAVELGVAAMAVPEE